MNKDSQAIIHYKPEHRLTPEQYSKLIEYLPFVPGWLAEAGCKPEDLAFWRISCEPIRDLEREAREGHGWKCYKPGNVFEVTLYLIPNGVLHRAFSRLEWESLYFITRPEALEDMAE